MQFVNWVTMSSMTGMPLVQQRMIAGHAAGHVFSFDKSHLDRCDAAVLVLPGGKSAHLELGYMIGSGKKGFVLFDKEPERWDIMYQFSHGIFFNLQEFLTALSNV
jgi:nucleoside 2-deoxyribosyltransferase